MNSWRHGVFESLRAYRDQFFLGEAHLDRLFASAHSLGWRIPFSREEILERMKNECERQGLKSSFVRVTIYRDWEKEIYDLAATIIPMKRYPQTYYNEGVTLATVPTRRNSPMAVSPQVKSNNALGGILALEEGRTQDIFEPLLLNDQGYVTEGTTCNFFIVKRNKIMTSPVYAGLLEGVTRDHVIRLAKEEGFAVEEIPLTRHDLYTADESFLTNTSMGVMPVRKVDGREIGAGRGGSRTAPTLGTVTHRLMLRLNQAIQEWEAKIDQN